MKNIIIGIFCLLFAAEEVAGKEDTKEGDLAGYHEFKSCFQDTGNGNRIPETEFTRFLYDIGGENEVDLYAVKMIPDYKGRDYFIIRITIGDASGDDGALTDYEFLLPFENGVPAGDDGSGYFSRAIAMGWNNDAGYTYHQSYTLNSDHTFMLTIYSEEGHGVTGYDTPVACSSIITAVIGDTGKLQAQSVDKAEFSSDFFDRKFLRQKSYDIKFAFPEAEPYILHMDNYMHTIPLFDPELTLEFYCAPDSRGEILTHFVSRNEFGEAIDEYVLGNPPGAKAKNKLTREADRDLIKGPLILKTSDGNIELTPEGAFRKYTTR